MRRAFGSLKFSEIFVRVSEQPGTDMDWHLKISHVRQPDTRQSRGVYVSQQVLDFSRLLRSMHRCFQYRIPSVQSFVWFSEELDIRTTQNSTPIRLMIYSNTRILSELWLVAVWSIVPESHVSCVEFVPLNKLSGAERLLQYKVSLWSLWGSQTQMFLFIGVTNLTVGQSWL